MLELVKKLLLFGFKAYMAFVALTLLFIGGIFAWNLLTYDRAEATFDAPSKPWSVRIEDSCLTGSCYKYPKVVVPDGWFSSHELQCDIGPVDTSRVVFDKVHKVTWGDDDTTLNWSAGEPPQSGRIDLRKDCYITAAFDDRPSLISLRFKENCLTGDCVRSVNWVESRGGYVFTTPCRVTATGNERVFTVPNDARGQVSVELDVASKRATWTSDETGQTGVVDYATDCDASKQTRREQPP